MRPSPPSKDYIYVPFVISLILYIGVNILSLPSPFVWLDKVVEFVAAALLAFLTAFPFWWIIEYFKERSERHRIASIQWNFTERSSSEMNAVFLVLCDGLNAQDTALTYALPAYLERFDRRTFFEGFADRFYNTPLAPGPLAGYLSSLELELSFTVGSMTRNLGVLSEYTGQFDENYTYHVNALRMSLDNYRSFIAAANRTHLDVHWNLLLSHIRRLVYEMSALHTHAAYR